jgi:hypothetical protein
LAVIDVDNTNLLPELKERIPEIAGTARVKTGRGYHYYFSIQNEGIKSTDHLFGKNLELKGNGRYIVAPPSVIRGHRYIFEVPLSRILPLPEVLQKTDLSASITEEGYHQKQKTAHFKIPKYHGRKVACIRQILKRDLKEGERNNSLFVLYNLLLQNKNSKDYARNMIVNKNQSLKKPLSEANVKKLFRRTYNYRCSSIREKLSYIKCRYCEYRFKHGKFKEDNLLIKNIRLLPKLSNTQRGIACLLGTVYEGENPSVTQIAEDTHMDWRVVSNAIKNLKLQGFLAE